MVSISSGHRTMTAKPLDAAAFAELGGRAIVYPEGKYADGFDIQTVNQGTSARVTQIAASVQDFEKCPSGKPASLRCNFAHCAPRQLTTSGGKQSIMCKILERHPFTTQSFFPMGRHASKRGYLVVVAKSQYEGGPPDLGTLSAFICNGGQGIMYGKAQWHAPMMALDEVSSFNFS